jgi:hypothetical protein
MFSTFHLWPPQTVLMNNGDVFVAETPYAKIEGRQLIFTTAQIIRLSLAADRKHDKEPFGGTRTRRQPSYRAVSPRPEDRG